MEGAKVKTYTGQSAVMNLIRVMIPTLLTIVSCATTSVMDAQKAADETYMKNMKVVVNDIEYPGIGVLPLEKTYEITIYPKEKADRIIVQNCHRELVFDKPKQGWFNKKFTFYINILEDAETNKLCQIEIASLNEKIKNSFAFFEIQDARPEITLPALLKCSGQQVFNKGVSICQSAEGLEQIIAFSEKVVNEDVQEECNKPQSQDGIKWTFIPNKNKCSYYFVARTKAKNGKRLAHRLTSIGYSTVPWEE